MVWLPPDGDLDPLQLPDAVHDVGDPVVVHVRIVLKGAVPLVGEAERLTVGNTAAVGVIVTETGVPVPALLEQLIVYVVGETIPVTVWLPDAALDPANVPPVAVQPVALLVLDHVKVVLKGAVPDVGDPENVTTGLAIVGVTVTDELAEPAPLLQVIA